jgi:hypothetical protein
MLAGNKFLIFIFFIFISVNIFAANPSEPFLPSDNILDPNCTPLDSNCYVLLTNISTSTLIMQGGNSFGTSTVIGTLDSNTLFLKTNGSNTMTLLANGNVGNWDKYTRICTNIRKWSNWNTSKYSSCSIIFFY